MWYIFDYTVNLNATNCGKRRHSIPADHEHIDYIIILIGMVVYMNGYKKSTKAYDNNLTICYRLIDANFLYLTGQF